MKEENNAPNDMSTFLNNFSRSKDTDDIILTQRHTLRQYEETNEMLKQFLELSESTQKELAERFSFHMKTLFTLKKNLEQSFKRIRSLKENLKENYPDAFKGTEEAISKLQEFYEYEDEQRYHSGIICKDNPSGKFEDHPSKKFLNTPSKNYEVEPSEPSENFQDTLLEKAVDVSSDSIKFERHDSEISEGFTSKKCQSKPSETILSDTPQVTVFVDKSADTILEDVSTEPILEDSTPSNTPLDGTLLNLP